MYGNSLIPSPVPLHCCSSPNTRFSSTLPHVPLSSTHQSAHMGGATNECSWWFYPCKSRRNSKYISVLPLLEKSPCSVVYIGTSLLELVQRRPLYLFIHVWCTAVSANSMLLNPTKKKSAWLVGKKSPCSCVNGQVVGPNRPRVFIQALLMHLPSLALYRLSFFFFIVFALSCWSSDTYQDNSACLPCVVTVPVMQVITVVFKWTSGPVKALEGKITYIALTS